MIRGPVHLSRELIEDAEPTILAALIRDKVREGARLFVVVESCADAPTADEGQMVLDA